MGNLNKIMQEFEAAGFKIKFRDGSFSLFMSCGRYEMIKSGWTLAVCSGLPCTYETRSKEAVRKALELGYEITQEARGKLDDPLFSDDPSWAVQKEVERVEKCRVEAEQTAKWIAANAILVESARAKLTEEEFEAVINESRE